VSANRLEFSFEANTCGVGLPPPVGCRRGIRVRVLRRDNQANSLAQNTLHRREEAVPSNDLSGHDLLLLFARGVIEEHYLIVTCTVMTDEPEVVGPCPVALMANVSPPLYLVFAWYS
jgi:hypothetical protein